MELIERAETYAEGKADEAITKAIAKAYEDGYRDGYKDREEEIPVDLRDNRTVYVDLGLPSGTLWAADYERENEEVLYLPYEKAAKYNIPTKEQWKELFECCFYCISWGGMICIGPNDNSIFFGERGYKEDERLSDNNANSYTSGGVYLWALDDEANMEKNIIYWSSRHGSLNPELKKFFCGYKLPIRLVRQKN